MLASDTVNKTPLGGALVSGESKEEVEYFLHHLKTWINKPLSLITLDFSSRLLSGVKEVFPNAPLQKCVFHAIQLLTRGYIKELTRIKRQYLLAHIKEWKGLRRNTIEMEKGIITQIPSKLTFSDTEHALGIYFSLQTILSQRSPKLIERSLTNLFSTSQFTTWKGHKEFLLKYRKIFTKSHFTFSTKALKYIIPKIYTAWRGAIMELRRELEATKATFNRAKYLILMNPDNMEPFHRRALRKYLKAFPWLRKYRRILVKFYYQFKIPPEKRRSLKFLLSIISKKSHPWLKAAVNTLIENEEDIFRYQMFRSSKNRSVSSKAIKIVNESANKHLNRLYRVQCGMRTLENLSMRISHRLSCPVIVSPGLKEKLN
ncbi:MAG: hypothetical protein EU542_09280 [Promethearchaeota archaeon]|nr:MAG: hypothetical protein EU542_09280 [Candidatus Lokiarchaeota archaeon]